MFETKKNFERRKREGYFEKYFVGQGIDIGCGPDPLLPDCRHWDLSDGDAQYLKSIADQSFDWVYSSHCLEHMIDPSIALLNWWRVLKLNGYLVIIVPDFALYEQFQWPSHYNSDHKHKFSLIFTSETINIVDLVHKLANAQLLLARINDAHFDYQETKIDRTRKAGQAEIEVIVRKLPTTYWAYRK